MREPTKKSLSNEQIATAPVTRRSAIGMLSAAVIGLSLEACHRGVRGGCSDSDPYDPGGGGRHCGGGYRTCSDRDPYDPGGRGRHC
jgi:hypothetical protein